MEAEESRIGGVSSLFELDSKTTGLDTGEPYRRFAIPTFEVKPLHSKSNRFKPLVVRRKLLGMLLREFAFFSLRGSGIYQGP